MVQLLLSFGKRKFLRRSLVRGDSPCFAAPSWSAKVHKEKVDEPAPPDLLLAGGRKLHYERSFSSEKEMEKKPGFFTKVLDVLIGQPEHPQLVRPYSIVVDSRGRAIVTDPGANGIHSSTWNSTSTSSSSAGIKTRIRCFHRSASPWMLRTTFM